MDIPWNIPSPQLDSKTVYKQEMALMQPNYEINKLEDDRIWGGAGDGRGGGGGIIPWH